MAADTDFPVKIDRAFVERVREVCEMMGGRKELAAAMGVGKSTVDKWAQGNSDPSRTNLIAMAAAADVSVEWLATGHAPQAGGAQRIKSPDGFGPDIDQAFALIPRYEVNLSAGPGLIPLDEGIEESLAFSKVWLSRQRISPDKAGLVRVRGDSMAPTLPDGALALVNTAEGHVEREGVYAFSRDGEAYVKRLVPVAIGPGGQPTSIVIISDGGTVAPEFLTGPQLNELRIVGRVRCILVNM